MSINTKVKTFLIQFKASLSALDFFSFFFFPLTVRCKYVYNKDISCNGSWMRHILQFNDTVYIFSIDVRMKKWYKLAQSQTMHYSIMFGQLSTANHIMNNRMLLPKLQWHVHEMCLVSYQYYLVQTNSSFSPPKQLEIVLIQL